MSSRTTHSKRRSSSSSSKPTVQRTNPALWERVKRQVKASAQGGPPGKWSARKAQLSVAKYKAAGGGYRGKRDPNNSLTKWSREKWDYISSNSKQKYGRYLPEVVRKNLSKSTQSAENRSKGYRHGQWVPYSQEVKSLMHRYGITKGRIRNTSSKQSSKHSSKSATKSATKSLKCWTGYERVPGTKAGAKGSCRRIGSK